MFVRIMIKAALLAPLLALALAATPAGAACYADYKAKQDNPLRLQYGVMQVSDGACQNPGAAAGEVSQRLARNGWQLLQVMSVFGEDGLAQRRGRAGEYFLRY